MRVFVLKYKALSANLPRANLGKNATAPLPDEGVIEHKGETIA
ncbi:hypothetical protein AQS8620_01527 [Aquimixticola soesokkakensis]|uniref:Uncharacterized protein n=1 Tax=Aquimixticola soesokkakensis TaxID=1519096 RepID=A0A1Y5SJ70_9RHOB|nr:hypothetical protein AQS8620_01527 [Aquimixticola soesokkakensis]